MKLTTRVKDIRTRFVAKFPVPQTTPELIEPIIRDWCTKFAQQVKFETKDSRYGVKRASLTRPICKDCLAYHAEDGLIAWDLLEGAGTGKPKLIPDPDAHVIPDQVFEPVTAVDHLGPVVVVPPPPSVGKTLANYFTFRDGLNRVYLEDLGRSVSGDPDAIVNWTYHWRENGQDLGWIRARIRESDEYKARHP